jgi:hypothetical protein
MKFIKKLNYNPIALSSSIYSKRTRLNALFNDDKIRALGDI